MLSSYAKVFTYEYSLSVRCVAYGISFVGLGKYLQLIAKFASFWPYNLGIGDFFH